MIQFTEATFEDGVFRPDQPLELAPQTRVRLVIEPCTPESAELSAPKFHVPSPEERAAAWKSIRQFWRTSTLNSHGERLTREQLHERR